MSQNGHSSMHSHSVINPPGSGMNLSSSPSSVSWSHANNGTSAAVASGSQSVSAVTAQQQDVKAASSPENSSQSGETLKEHDLLGLSEVSSSSSRESPVQEGVQDEGNEFEELNLKMELGPPAARKKADTGFSLPKTSPAVEQQQPLAAPENGNSHGASEGNQAAEQVTVVVDKNCSASEQNGSAAEQADRGLCYGAPSQGGRTDAGAQNTGCRPAIDSEALMKWHAEQAGDRKSSGEGLRLGISLHSQRGGTQDGLNEKKTFLSSMERNREAPQELNQQEDPSWQQERIFQEDVASMEKTQERPIVGQEQQQQQVIKQQQQHQQQQQLERLKQYEVYQMSEKRSVLDRKCLPALQQPGPEQRFQNVPERSPRLSESQNRLWQSQMKFRPECMVTSSTQFQQHSAQQDIEASRAGYSVCAGNFAVNRNMYAAQKLGVTGSKRNFDAITGCDARNVNEARNGLSGPSVVAGGSMSTGNGPSAEAEGKALSQQQMKVPPPMQMYPWGQKTPLATPTWHIGLEQSGGSFGPFPSAQRPTPGTSVSKTASEIGAGVGGDAKTWDGQSKGHQDIVSTSSRKMPAPADVKQASTEATAVLPETSTASAQRAAAPAPAAVGWPPLRSFRKNLAVTPRPIPSETPAPRQPSTPNPTPTPTPVSTPSIAGQSNSWFVKVNMDGYPVGRKVDLRINSSYDKLSQALDEMFRPQFETFLNGQNGQNRISLPSDLKRNFLQGPDFVLTYEDQDGDLMLVGDVPWTMFIDTVKRLRIMKGSEAIGLGNRAAEKSVKTAQPNV